MRALILENTRLYQQLLDTILGQHGFENDISDEVSEALTLLERNHYDLICTNDYLKDGSGIELAVKTAAMPQHRDTPMLLLTAADQLVIDSNLALNAEVVYKRNLQQISDQIVHFLDEKLDSIFGEGRVLLMEDSPAIANMIAFALRSEGFQVDHFASAEEGWHEFVNEVSYGSDTSAFDLVITDINLAGDMTGLDLTTRIRALDDARGLIPIMAITAQADQDLRLSLFRAGVHDFIQKPILADELQVRARNLITNKRLLDKVHDQRRALYEMATTDKLTGCQNRHSLMENSSKLISQAIRHAFPVSILVIDLDHFKQVNDNHGHAIGDQVLSDTGALLLKSFRNEDLVARFGGEEFVIMLAHCDAAAACHKAEQLRSALHQRKPAGLLVTASIGVSALEPPQQIDFETLFHNADQGVYKAKEMGRNQVQLVVDTAIDELAQ